MGRVLVAYFSATGTTKKVAEVIADVAKADIYEITPKTLYTSADLDWTDKTSRSSVEMKDKTYRPEIVETECNIDDYDTVLLGFPIWWYVAPTIVNTFLETYHFTKKKIVLFATSEGSGFGNTIEELKPSAPESILIEGKICNHVTKEEIADWVTTL